MPESKPVRFGIMGCGGAAMPMAEAISVSPVAKLAAAYDLNPALARGIGKAANIGQQFFGAGHVELTAWQHEIGLDVYFPENDIAR